MDVTVTCPVGWTWVSGHLNLLHSDRAGGGGTFSASCTGTAQVARSRAVNGNRFTLGNWNASAYVTIARSGQTARADTARTIRLEPGVTARVADQGQLTGTSGGGVRLALAVACPIGATGQQSSVTVTQGTAQAQAFFTPICDRFSHTVVLSLPASQGTFQTGSAVANASVTVGWNGESFSGADNRTITVLESSTGDTTPPTTPAGLWRQYLRGHGDLAVVGRLDRQRDPDGPDRLRGVPQRPVRPADQRRLHAGDPVCRRRRAEHHRGVRRRRRGQPIGAGNGDGRHAALTP